MATSDVQVKGSYNEKKKILMVDYDDHPTTTDFLLESEYEICRIPSGTIAIRQLFNREFAPDLIMLDVIMPIMDGWEIFNKIRAIDFLKNVPILFFTSLDEEEEREKAFKLGAVDYIIKPCEEEELKSRIKKALEIGG